MKLYVQRLPQILAKKKQLATHTAIAECIKDVTDSYEFLDTLQVKIIAFYAVSNEIRMFFTLKWITINVVFSTSRTSPRLKELSIMK